MKTEIYLSHLKISTRSFLAAILAGVIEKSNPMTTVIVIVKIIVKKSGKTLNGRTSDIVSATRYPKIYPINPPETVSISPSARN